MGFKPTLEVPVFFATFGFMLTSSVNSNLLIYRTCYVLLHFNKSECALLGFVSNNVTEYLEKQVEPTSTYINLMKTIMESVCGSVLCLFIAPWSDRFGRKPVLVLGFVGGTVALVLHIVFAALENLTPWFLLVLSVPVLVTGGGASFVTILSAYLTDSTTKEKRALRMGIFDGTMALAVLLGNTTSSYLLIATSYVMVYCVATCFHLVALFYTIFFIKESLRERETHNPIGNLFSLSNLKDMLKTPFKARDNGRRVALVLIMGSMVLGCLAGGSMSLFFFFVREKFQWELTQITWFGTVTNILGIVAAIIVVYFLHTLLKIREPMLIFVGTIFSVVSLVTAGLAVKTWQIYLSAILNLPASGQSALMRSLISKLVHEEEVAKVLSAFSISSNVLGPFSSAGYTALYNKTINTDPGLYNFVTAAILLSSALIFMYVLFLQDRFQQDYSALVNESDTNSSDIVTSGEPQHVSASEVPDNAK